MSELTALLWTMGIMGFMTAATWYMAPDSEEPGHQQANAPVHLSHWWWIVLGIEALAAGVGMVWMLPMPFGLTCVVVLLFLLGDMWTFPLSGWNLL